MRVPSKLDRTSTPRLRAENERLRVALEIYAKPENWKPYKTQHKRIWIHHCYEDGFKIAHEALRPEQPAESEGQK